MSNKRQRHVFPTDEIAHLWAHKTQEDARNPQGNFYFSGESIYSYGQHFEIARHVTRETKHGLVACVLLTTRGYSSTTASHVSLVRRSVSHLTVFTVEVFAQTEAAHEANVADYRKRVAAIAGQAKRARVRKASLAEAAHNLAEQANRYIRFFDLPYEPLGTDIEELVAQAQREAQAAAEKAHEEALKLQDKYAPAVLYWKTHGLQGGPVEDSYYFPQAKLPCYLRSDSPRLVISTSWGAEIPIDHAERAYKIVSRLRFHQRTFQANGKKIAVGHYQIESVDIHGNIKAGCHYITWDEIKDLAQRLGWTESVVLPDDEATPAPSESIPGEHDVVLDAINEASLHQ